MLKLVQGQRGTVKVISSRRFRTTRQRSKLVTSRHSSELSESRSNVQTGLSLLLIDHGFPLFDFRECCRISRHGNLRVSVWPNRGISISESSRDRASSCLVPLWPSRLKFTNTLSHLRLHILDKLLVDPHEILGAIWESLSLWSGALTCA